MSISPAPEHKAKALIVDDSATMRSTLNAFLAEAGIEVIGQLANGSQLLQMISRASPDIVCLDYNLPDINGLELLKTIVSVHPEIAVVIITGEQAPDLRQAAAQAGAAGFIHKPFSEDQIIKEIRHIIQTQRLLAVTHKSITKAAPDQVAEFTVRKTAIIADDSKTMRRLLMVILAAQNIDVLAEATDGAQAVELVALHQPDIACLDIDMPSMNGLEALRAIRQKHPATKVLMITGNTRREVVLEAVKLGAVGFVAKPFDPAKVGEALAKVMR